MNNFTNFKFIFSFIAGSHLYGTNIEGISDIDIRGVFIPTKEYFLGFNKKIEQIECKVEDTTHFDIRKFLNLALDNNPNILEFLFVPENKITVSSKEWEDIMNNRNYFLSSRARWTFSGYAVSQLHRVKKHRYWLLRGHELKEPKRGDFGLPENRSIISSDQIGAFNVILATRLREIGQMHELRIQLEEMSKTLDYTGTVQSMGAKITFNELTTLLPEYSENFILAVSKEKQYAGAKKEWEQFLNWKKTRNPVRAALEEKYGYDCKHSAHCYRLIKEGEEFLKTGFITFPRPDAELLLAIRNGCWKYEELLEKIENVDNHFDLLYKETKLPREPNRGKIDDLCVSMVENYILKE